MIVCANKEVAYVLEMNRQWLLSFSIKIEKLKPQFGTTIRLDLSMQQSELRKCHNTLIVIPWHVAITKLLDVLNCWS